MLSRSRSEAQSAANVYGFFVRMHCELPSESQWLELPSESQWLEPYLRSARSPERVLTGPYGVYRVRLSMLSLPTGSTCHTKVVAPFF